MSVRSSSSRKIQECPASLNNILLLWVDEYADCLAAMGRTAQHVSETRNECRAVVINSGATDAATFTEPAIMRGLGKILARGRGLATVESHRRAIRAFCRWAAKRSVGHLLTNPAEDVPSYKPDSDPRHERASFSDQQLARLLKTTAASPRMFGEICGRDRAELYHAAVCTGLRASTLRKLTVSQFDLDGEVACVRVRADQLKDGQPLHVPIHPSSAARLKKYFAGKMPQARAFRIPAQKQRVVIMLRRDLKDAGIEYCQEIELDNEQIRREHVLDFHALRHTFCSRGAVAGVPLTVMQGWMGHSDPKLTSNIYAHVQLPDALAALLKVPPIPGIQSG